MQKVIFMGEDYEADMIIKTETSIIGYDGNGIEVFAFRGISDFSGYKLIDEHGNPAEFSILEPTEPQPTETELLAAELSLAIAEMQTQMDMAIAELSMAIATQQEVQLRIVNSQNKKILVIHGRMVTVQCCTKSSPQVAWIFTRIQEKNPQTKKM